MPKKLLHKSKICIYQKKAVTLQRQTKHRKVMKRVPVFLVCWLVVLSIVSCASQSNNPLEPASFDYDTRVLVRSVTNLDTITPPNNPLHPLPTEAQDLPCFYGYLDLARYADNRRYCALIGVVDESKNVYFLTDSDNGLFRYDSPLVADCRVGELLYVRGHLTQEPVGNYYLLKLQVVDIEKTDSIVTREYVYPYLR